MPGPESLDISGCLRKLGTTHQSPVQYSLRFADNETPLNPWLDYVVTIEHSGHIECINCSRTTRKSFQQGYCFACFKRLPECDSCIMSPEKCHYHEGTCRDPVWGEAHCFQPHVVYLANTSGLKVGITRGTQVPTRWMDQGAVQAVPVASVANRQLAGFVEDSLRKHTSDRTQWQRMLKGQVDTLNLSEQWKVLKQVDEKSLEALREQHGADAIEWLDAEPVRQFEYPLDNPPDKVKALNLDKTPALSGVLQGIKGQYLVLDTGVLNVRKFGGYEVRVQAHRS